MSLRDQIRQVMNQRLDIDDQALVADEVAEIDALDGADSGTIADAIRHYADTSPVEHADALSQYLVSESPVNTLDDVALFAETGVGIPEIEFAETDTFDAELADSDLVEDPDKTELDTEYDEPDFESYEAPAEIHQANLDDSYESAEDDSFSDDSYGVDLDDDAPEFDPSDIDFE